nr:MAG TPA: hypothetical protein [Caudoviricetes sp.]
MGGYLSIYIIFFHFFVNSTLKSVSRWNYNPIKLINL